MQVTNEGVECLASAAKQLQVVRLFGTSASRGVRCKFARPPVQTVLLEKDAWWLNARL